MSVKFKVIERVQPGVPGGGEKKFYAQPVMDGEATLADLTREIEKISTVSGADIRAVLYAMIDVAVTILADGTIVRLGELGSLRVSLSSEGRATEKEVNASAIKGASVIFTPGPRIKEALNTMKFVKE